MRPFVISLYSTNNAQELFIRGPSGRRGEAVVYKASVDRERGNDLSHPNDAYYADDEESARQMAERLATDNPGTSFLISKTTAVVTGQKPDKIPLVSAKFTEQGYVPE